MSHLLSICVTTIYSGPLDIAAALPSPPEFAQTESSRLLLNEAKSRK